MNLILKRNPDKQKLKFLDQLFSKVTAQTKRQTCKSTNWSTERLSKADKYTNRQTHSLTQMARHKNRLTEAHQINRQTQWQTRWQDENITFLHTIRKNAWIFLVNWVFYWQWDLTSVLLFTKSFTSLFLKKYDMHLSSAIRCQL